MIDTVGAPCYTLPTMDNTTLVNRLVEASDRRPAMNRIREVREAAGLTQRQLADKAGMEQSSLARLEGGSDYARERAAGRPKLETLQRLAVALGARWWELLDEEDLRGLRAELREELDRATMRLAAAGVPLDEAHRGVDMAYARTP